MAFPGVVVSDWQAIKELIAHGIANDGATAARKAFLAGVDMDMESGLYQQTLAQLVRSGAVPQAALDEAVRRVLRLKLALGLFDHPYTPETPTPQQLKPENRGAGAHHRRAVFGAFEERCSSRRQTAAAALFCGAHASPWLDRYGR